MTRPRRVLFLGCGSVTQAALPLLIRDVKVAPSAITVELSTLEGSSGAIPA